MRRRAEIRGQLLAALDEAFDGKGWHGPTLWGALRGVTAECAAWRPAPDRHNIWELATHTAFWKHAVLNRITGGPLERFEPRGSNWFARPVDPSASAWRLELGRLKVQHDRLRAAVERLDDRALTGRNIRGRDKVDQTVRGIAAHDVYHAGQIQLLKQMWKASA